jgi:hypothetical protein
LCDHCVAVIRVVLCVCLLVAEKAVAVLQQDEPPAEEVLVALEGVQSLCDNLDLAQILGKIGGMGPLIRLLGHADDRVRPMAAETLATSVQNDELTQSQAASEGALLATAALVESEARKLLASSAAAGSSTGSTATADAAAGWDTGLYKALHSLSALVRSSPALSLALVTGQIEAAAPFAPSPSITDATRGDSAASASPQLALSAGPGATLALAAPPVSEPVVSAVSAPDASASASAATTAALAASAVPAGAFVKSALIGDADEVIATAGAASLLALALRVPSVRCRQRALMLMQSLLESPDSAQLLKPDAYGVLLEPGAEGHGLARLCHDCSDAALLSSTAAPYLVNRSLAVAQRMLHMAVEHSLSAAYAATAVADSGAAATGAGAPVLSAADIGLLHSAADAVAKHCAGLSGEDAAAVEEEAALARRVVKLARMVKPAE